MQSSQSVVRPAMGWCSTERSLELPLRLGVTASLQQGRGKRLPDRIVPIWWLSVGQCVLQRSRALEPHDGGAIVALGLGYARQDQCARDAKHLLCWEV